MGENTCHSPSQDVLSLTLSSPLCRLPYWINKMLSTISCEMSAHQVGRRLSTEFISPHFISRLPLFLSFVTHLLCFTPSHYLFLLSLRFFYPLQSLHNKFSSRRWDEELVHEPCTSLKEDNNTHPVLLHRWSNRVILAEHKGAEQVLSAARTQE